MGWLGPIYRPQAYVPYMDGWELLRPVDLDSARFFVRTSEYVFPVCGSLFGSDLPFSVRPKSVRPIRPNLSLSPSSTHPAEFAPTSARIWTWSHPRDPSMDPTDPVP